MPTLSAFIICYKQGHLLGRQLAAFSRQDVQPDEVILIDDASPDNTAELMQRYCESHSNARFIRNQQNMGVIETINIGLRAATGDFVYCAAADDEIQPGFFAAMMEIISAHPECGLAFCDPIWEIAGHAREERYGLAPSSRYFSPDELVALFRALLLRFLPGHCTIWRRAAFVEQGLMRPLLGGVCDSLPMWSVALRYGACYVPRPLALALLSPDTWGQRQGRDRRKVFQDYLALVDALMDDEFADIRPRLRASRILSRNFRALRPLLARGKLFTLLDGIGAARLFLSWFRAELRRMQDTLLGFGPARVAAKADRIAG
ncbi:MAG: glycosyltransferase family A protein [Rhizomicrobium sp.]